MFFGGGDDDDDNDFAPSTSTGSKLSALFGGPSKKSSNLKYVPPKQPRSDSMGSGGEKNNPPATGQQPQVQPQAPAVLIATAVHAYLYVNDAAQSQGRAMCCLLGNVAEKSFQLLLYRSKQDHLTRARIHQQFNFTVLPNNYATFSDDQQRSWSIMIDTGQYTDFVTQVGVCRAMLALPGNSGQHLTQDVIVGDGPALKEGDHAQLSYTTWSISDGKKGAQVEESKSGQRIKLKEGASNWETRLLGAQKNSRRLIFLPKEKDNTSVIFHDVTIERVKQKGGGDQSGRSTPQVDLQSQHKEMSSSNRSLNMLPEDSENSIDNEGAPHSKATIVSRMARMGGHALLPSVVNSRHPPTDSESEVEEISRRRKQKYTSGSISGSVEELEATPALRSRASSARSDAMKPEPAPRPNHLPHQPQQLMVYQSPWQQPAMLPPGYTAVQPGTQTLGVGYQPPVAPGPDPTISLLFSETRSQSTEVKISVSKMSDKIDNLSSKIEKMELQLKQQGGTVPVSAVVPANMMTPQVNYFHPSNSVDAQAILAQITTLVNDNDDMKARLEDKEKKITTMSESVTQLLQKNQKLLEEKTDMLIAKQDAGTTVSITEVLALREEKASIVAQLGIAQGQLTAVKEEVLESKKLMAKQEEEMKNLQLQLHEEQAKGVDLENTSEAQKIKEMELMQSLKDAESEKERLKTLLEANESQKNESQADVSDLSNKKVELEKRLQATESERDSLKEQLKFTLQQMEERTRGDGESSTEKEMESQIRDDLHSKISRVNQLEQELADLQTRCSEIKEEQSQQSSQYQAQIQKLEAEKESLENSSNPVKTTSPNPEEVVGTVKKVMNTVFRTLKPQFSDEESYTGAAVMQTLLSVIRDTTLQLLEDVDKKDIAKENLPKSEIPSNSQEDRGNGANDVGISQMNPNNESSENVSGTRDSSFADSYPVKNNSEVNCERIIHDDDGEDINKEIIKEKGEAGEEILRECIVENDCDKEIEIENFEDRTEVSSSEEGEYTDASDRQFTPNSSISSSSSSSYDCEQSINTVSLDSGTEKDMSVGIIQGISDEDKAPSPHDNVGKDQRTPVIDMENTEAATVPASEKSDSSRDSSLDRAWRPQPPPPPLFSDEEDDDDWLS